jgi:hypothetical protein
MDKEDVRLQKNPRSCQARKKQIQWSHFSMLDQVNDIHHHNDAICKDASKKLDHSQKKMDNVVSLCHF